MPHTLDSKLPAAGRGKFSATAVLPIALFIVLVIALGYGLTRDPREIPSPLIGKPVPEFSLPALPGRDDGLATTDLKGQVSLVNVFASWCTACRQEHPLFMQLKKDKVVPIHGIDYRDQPQDALAWLAELGDPYTRIGVDRDARVSIDWGVYGVPETFLIDRQGRIAYKQIGAITPTIFKEIILPRIRELRK